MAAKYEPLTDEDIALMITALGGEGYGADFATGDELFFRVIGDSGDIGGEFLQALLELQELRATVAELLRGNKPGVK